MNRYQCFILLKTVYLVLTYKLEGIGLKVSRDYIIEPLYYKSIPGDKETIADYTHWSLKNVNRTLMIEGNYTFTQDMDNTFVCGLDSAFSPKGNNKFEKNPMRLPESHICQFYNNSYRKYIEPHFIGKTNFPTIPSEGLCPLPKGNYWAKGVTLDEDVLPNHIPRGLWRLEESFYRTKPKREMVGGIQVYARVLDRY